MLCRWKTQVEDEEVAGGVGWEGGGPRAWPASIYGRRGVRLLFFVFFFFGLWVIGHAAIGHV